MDGLRTLALEWKQKVVEMLPAAGDTLKDMPAKVVPVNQTISQTLARVPVPHSNVEARNEILMKLFGTLASLGISVLAIRYMMNALDPTKNEKKKSRDRVNHF